jgi:hypothetical protein
MAIAKIAFIMPKNMRDVARLYDKYGFITIYKDKRTTIILHIGVWDRSIAEGMQKICGGAITRWNNRWYLRINKVLEVKRILDEIFPFLIKQRARVGFVLNNFIFVKKAIDPNANFDWETWKNFKTRVKGGTNAN